MNCKIILFITTYESIFSLHTHAFNGPFSGTTGVSRYQKGKTNLDFIEARAGRMAFGRIFSLHAL